MKKLHNLKIAATCLIIAVVVTMACNKTNETPVAESGDGDLTELLEKSKAMQQHVEAFKAKMEYYRDNPGVKGSEELVQIASTILDWEATINYTYCYTNLELGEIQKFDTILDIPLIKGDSITTENVSVKYYNHILESIQEKYFLADFQNKNLISVDLEPINGGDSLFISLLVGNPSAPAFPNYDWYWGNTEGVCVSHECFGEKDAAIVLATDIRNYFYQTPPNNCRWFFTDIIEYEDNNPLMYPNPDNTIINNYCDYLIYYANQNVSPGLTENVRCIESATEMDFYRQNYITITQGHVNNAPIYLEGQMKFKTCSYTGIEVNLNYEHYIEHNLETRLGRRFLECSTSVEDISQY